MNTCPNCGKELRKGIMKSVELLSQKKIDFINDFSEEKKKAYCTHCGKSKYEKIKLELNNKLTKLKTFINNNIDVIPVVSTHTPFNWNYQIVDIVTGQTTTGTGIVSEVTSSFTDFFGTQSKSFNKKIAAGEKSALGQLRAKAFELGANAIIATDIDYAELGSLKGMIMVCATGTAVKLLNTDIIGNERSATLNELLSRTNEYKELLQKYKPFINIYQTNN